MEQSPFWETNRFSASQGISHILWKQNVHYRNNKCPPPVPILSQLDQIHTPHIQLLKHSLLLPSHLFLFFQVDSFPQVSPPNPCVGLSSPPYMLHAPPIQFSSILSPEQYPVRFADHKVPHYVLFSANLLLRDT